MLNRKLKIRTGIIFVITITAVSGCSVMSKVGKTAKNLTTFGSGNGAIAVDDTLVIPPSLKIPVDGVEQGSKQAKTSTQQPQAATMRKAANSGKNYYIVVGTYPDQGEALDTFVRLSSIGLKGATMESRVTKSGNSLHMVRLGPYTNQEDIDKTKDSLTSDGLSQFKVVEN